MKGLAMTVAMLFATLLSGSPTSLSWPSCLPPPRALSLSQKRRSSQWGGGERTCNRIGAECARGERDSERARGGGACFSAPLTCTSRGVPSNCLETAAARGKVLFSLSRAHTGSHRRSSGARFFFSLVDRHLRSSGGRTWTCTADDVEDLAAPDVVVMVVVMVVVGGGGLYRVHMNWDRHADKRKLASLSDSHALAHLQLHHDTSSTVAPSLLLSILLCFFFPITATNTSDFLPCFNARASSIVVGNTSPASLPALSVHASTIDGRRHIGVYDQPQRAHVQRFDTPAPTSIPLYFCKHRPSPLLPAHARKMTSELNKATNGVALAAAAVQSSLKNKRLPYHRPLRSHLLVATAFLLFSCLAFRVEVDTTGKNLVLPEYVRESAMERYMLRRAISAGQVPKEALPFNAFLFFEESVMGALLQAGLFLFRSFSGIQAACVLAWLIHLVELGICFRICWSCNASFLVTLRYMFCTCVGGFTQLSPLIKARDAWVKEQRATAAAASGAAAPKSKKRQ
ncbi:hypothetical protein, conserved [Leishmania tarentolae]|uniref:Uncharacterized protein n=1 Tax=Leishmania tarentolae TaxID=5689 RepID=A0A640KKW5_LEITA|nr:hypothetical protein, conserved [Leishmania tarentolae]